MGKTVREVLAQLGGKRKKRKDKGAGTKKYGRNLTKCSRYRALGRREFNKARKQARIVKILAKKALRKARKEQ